MLVWAGVQMWKGVGYARHSSHYMHVHRIYAFASHLIDHGVEERAGVGHVEGEVGEELVEPREALAELLARNDLGGFKWCTIRSVWWWFEGLMCVSIGGCGSVWRWVGGVSRTCMQRHLHAWTHTPTHTPIGRVPFFEMCYACVNAPAPRWPCHWRPNPTQGDTSTYR